MIRYRLGFLDDGWTKWLLQWRKPKAGQVIETWACDEAGQPIQLRSVQTPKP